MNRKKELKEKLMNKYLGSTSFINCMFMRFVKSDGYHIYKFLFHLKYYEYLITLKTNPIKKIQRLLNLREYQKHAQILGFTIGDGVLGENITFFHKGNIMINPAAKVGDGCMFHGNCCIGVSRTFEEGAPVIGKNVDIGFGAVILGDIYIADNIKIGANAVVTKSFYEPGITIAGVPAKRTR